MLPPQSDLHNAQLSAFLNITWSAVGWVQLCAPNSAAGTTCLERRNGFLMERHERTPRRREFMIKLAGSYLVIVGVIMPK